ncbi:MAG: GspH/FimT family pseudopilin [Candidatus Omnitrophica bacterium]|nr:GspH/FimT family pseudopilin [Candidatus Omnitrophota bacterium]
MMTLITGRPNKRKNGFTLLEIILLMVTVGTVLALVAPSLRTFMIARQVRHTATQFLSLAGYARSQAIAEGRTYRLNVDRQEGRFWLTAEQAGSFQNLKNEFGRIFSLPAGTRVEPVTESQVAFVPEVPGLWLPGYTGKKAEEGQMFISFFPDGRTEPLRWRLTDCLGQSVTLLCQSSTEIFRIEEEKAQP